MTTIATCLWFDGDAETAATFYTSLLPGQIDQVHRSPADNPSMRQGEVLTVDFTLDGQKFIGLNGGPDFPFTEAISISVLCEDQAEVDRLWSSLTADGGEPGQCGWLKDRFGVSWQIVPRILPEMFDGPDRAGAKRAMEAMLRMTKLDVRKLQEAYEGVPV